MFTFENNRAVDIDIALMFTVSMNNLKQYRVLAGLTQEQLGALVGLHKMNISNYERGKRGPSVKMANAIVAALQKKGVECSLDSVFGESTRLPVPA